MKKIVCIKCTADLGVHSHGAEAHVINYFLERLNKIYDEVHIVGNEISYLNYKSKKFNYFPYIKKFPILSKMLHIPISTLTLLRYCKKNKPNLIISLGAVYSNGFAAYICARWYNIKFLIRPAEDYFNTWKFSDNFLKKIYYYFFRNLLSNYIIKNSDYAIFPGYASFKYYSNKFKNKNYFYLNGPLHKIKFKKKKKIKKKFKTILFVAPISDLKGASFLPFIIKSVLRVDQNFKFIIIGENNNDYIYNQIIAIGSKNVKLVNPVSNYKIYDYFKQSDLLIFLTKVGVGVGLINLEATKSGLPAISYNAKLDVKNFFKKNNYNNLNLFIDKILSKKYKLIKLDKSWSAKYIDKKFYKIIKKIQKE